MRQPSYGSGAFLDEAIRLAKVFDVLPQQITAWKAQLQEGVAGVFGSGPAGAETAPVVDLKLLHAKIGELTLERDFLFGALSKAGLLPEQVDGGEPVLERRRYDGEQYCSGSHEPDGALGVQRSGIRLALRKLASPGTNNSATRRFVRLSSHIPSRNTPAFKRIDRSRKRIMGGQPVMNGRRAKSASLRAPARAAFRMPSNQTGSSRAGLTRSRCGGPGGEKGVLQW